MSARKDSTSESRTLLTSVLLSAPGPLILAVGLLFGNSSTQIADFFRRTAELAAIICAYIVYRLTMHGEVGDEARRAQMERSANKFIGAMMCVAGIAMALMAVIVPSSDKGNVVLALVIAAMGLVANSIFWVRYTQLNRRTPNAIIAVQARLYRAKTFVDACVTTALLTVLLAPGTALASGVDAAGSIAVAVYMIYTGVSTYRQGGKGKGASDAG